MSSPPVKPWEKPGVNNQHTTPPPSNSSSGVTDLNGVADPGGGGGGGRRDNLPMATAATLPPPIPSRPNEYNSGYSGASAALGGYSGLGGGGLYGGLGGYGGGMYGNSMYGGYGGVGAYNRYGMYSGNNGAGTNSFVRMAEENSRQAFQSIEGIVQAFGSVAMMLESTYSAVFNSFRAVIGVADHFSRMRTQLAQIFSALAVVRTLRWLYRRLLVLLRLREGGLQEDAWASAVNDAFTASGPNATTGGASGPPRANWPLLLFFAVIIGGPYLIWKFLASIAGNSGDGWASGEEDHFLAEVLFDFTARSEEEVSVRQGQRITLAPKELQSPLRNWMLASPDGIKMGLIPLNYIKILGLRRGRSRTSQPPSPAHKSAGASLPSSGTSVRTTTPGGGDNNQTQQQCDMDSVWQKHKSDAS